MTTKLGRDVTYHKSHDPSIMLPCEVTCQIKLNLHYYNVYGHKTCQDLPGSYVTSEVSKNNVTLPYNYFDHVVLSDHVKYKISYVSAAKTLWPLHLVRWWLSMRSSLPQCYTVLGTRGSLRPRDNWKHYLHYRNAFGHHTWQDCYIHWRASLHKVKKPFDELVLQGHVTN